MLEQTDKDKKKDAVAVDRHAPRTSLTTMPSRRMTYTADAHMSGPEGDMTALRIELFLKPSGDELERAEAYENVMLREQSRETKGQQADLHDRQRDATSSPARR